MFVTPAYAQGMGATPDALISILPFVLIFVPGPARLLVVLQIAVIYLIRIVLTVRFRTSWMGCILHPVGEVLSLAIGLNSWRKLATKGVTWKGRVYQSS